ncbi:phosphate acyltransferase [Vagococcus zengguangii]|uniref:Uncharacterized protein n=1 Tax=Vagococcus zengguangii TaxID=2571750 RepID=A0A4D7CXA7_9ENTE|nr:phosphate acyltransferase [Vagococcus zengguangii]QCI86670.1 hypothetical protein FA707_06660 [Vagococcus zengguangii]TLG78290.1 hypothetical protein FE258_09690 [Vagococcus zengguangii]
MPNEIKPVVAVAGATQGFVDSVVKDALEQGLCEFLLYSDVPLEIPATGVSLMSGLDEQSMVDQAVKSIVEKRGTLLMKGSVQTFTILRAVLKKENGLRKSTVLSQVSAIQLKESGRLLLLTDPALNIQPTVEDKIAITQNAIEVAHKMGIEVPKVALLSSVEVFNPNIPSSADAHEVATYFENNPEAAIIDGPISFDIATSHEAATIKGYPGSIKGDADVLVVPTIDGGNFLYKVFSHFVPSIVSGVVVGAAVPIALSSRSDDLATKMASLRLAIKTSL